MNTWATTTTLSGPRLLPEGTNTYTVRSARPEVNEYSGNREAELEVESSQGSGSFTIPLECWRAGDQDAEDLFASIFKGQAEALGFEPGNPEAPLATSVTEFAASYLPTLIGAVVELYVQNKVTEKIKDGEVRTYTNQRVYVNKLVQAAQNVTAPTTTSVHDDDQIPF